MGLLASLGIEGWTGTFTVSPAIQFMADSMEVPVDLVKDAVKSGCETYDEIKKYIEEKTRIK